MQQPVCELDIQKFCSIPPPVGDGDDCDGKVVEAVFEYTGAGCADPLANPQEGKAKCEGDPMGAEPIDVVYTGKDPAKITVSPQSVIVGDTFAVTATGRDRLHSNTKLDLGSGAQRLEIHTSCSKDLTVGDRFGSLILREFVPQGGSPSDGEVIYTYLVSHSGSGDVVVDVDDDQLGLIAEDLVVPEGVTVELSRAAVLTETTTNVAAVLDVDGVCADDMDSVTVTTVIPPASCADGKPKALVFQYTGDSCEEGINSQNKDECSGDPMDASNVSIVVTRDASKVSASPDSGVNVGDLVTVTTTDSKLRAETELDIVGGAETQSLNIHTSCSDDLVVGDQFGSLLLVEFIPE